MEDSQINDIARRFADLIAEDNASRSANAPTPMARIGGAIREALAAMTAARDAQAEAARVWRRAAKAGYNLSLYAAASREDNTPEYVEGIMEECQSTQDEYEAALANPIARAAVEGK